MAPAKEISTDAAVAALFSQLDGIFFHVKRRTMKGTERGCCFSGELSASFHFYFLRNGFGKSLVGPDINRKP